MNSGTRVWSVRLLSPQIRPDQARSTRERAARNEAWQRGIWEAQMPPTSVATTRRDSTHSARAVGRAQCDMAAPLVQANCSTDAGLDTAPVNLRCPPLHPDQRPGYPTRQIHQTLMFFGRVSPLAPSVIELLQCGGAPREVPFWSK